MLPGRLQSTHGSQHYSTGFPLVSPVLVYREARNGLTLPPVVLNYTEFENPRRGISMTNQSGSQLPALPPLVDLPVVRSTYCNQDLTNTLLLQIWSQKPEWIQELSKLESEPNIYEVRTFSDYENIIDDLTDFLRQSCLEGKHLTRLGLLDLIYELTRRLRKTLKLPQLPILGNPLAPSADGPFPPLEDVPVWPSNKMTQEIADRILHKAYIQSPEVFFEQAEQMRRSLKTYEIKGEVWQLLRKIVDIEDSRFLGILPELSGEVGHRLFVMCKMKINSQGDNQ